MREKTRSPFGAAFALLIAAGCAGRVPPGAASAGLPPSPAAAVSLSDVPDAARVSIPEAPLERRKAALFDSDLGPDSLNVENYPPEQRRNYRVYARVCSRCHTLARSINAPYVSRGWWEFYAANMRMRALRRDESLEKREIVAILDFLEYDSNARKIADAAAFDQLRFVLKKRFEAALDERVKALDEQAVPPGKF
ncbi:MAG: hypothetical protein ACHQ51_04355 [Elusimicrobiota bacterium]